LLAPDDISDFSAGLNSKAAAAEAPGLNLGDL